MAYISINTSDADAPRAAELLGLVVQAQSLRMKARVIKEAMEAINSDDGIAAVAAKFGLPVDDAHETYLILASLLKLADGVASVSDGEALHDLCVSFGR